MSSLRFDTSLDGGRVEAEEQIMEGFKNIRFSFDHEGNLFPKEKDVTIEQLKAKSFQLLTTTWVHHPAIQVKITYSQKGIENHPWSDGDDPPSVLLIMVFPNIYFLDHLVEISGLEYPNMLYAGMIMPPYYKENAVKGVEYTCFRKLHDQLDLTTLKGFKFQKIILW